MNNISDQIDPSNAPVLNGGGVLNLIGTNSLAGLTFDNNGNGAADLERQAAPSAGF